MRLPFLEKKRFLFSFGQHSGARRPHNFYIDILFYLFIHSNSSSYNNSYSNINGN